MVVVCEEDVDFQAMASGNLILLSFFFNSICYFESRSGFHHIIIILGIQFQN